MRVFYNYPFLPALCSRSRGFLTTPFRFSPAPYAQCKPYCAAFWPPLNPSIPAAPAPSPPCVTQRYTAGEEIPSAFSVRAISAASRRPRPWRICALLSLPSVHRLQGGSYPPHPFDSHTAQTRQRRPLPAILAANAERIFFDMSRAYISFITFLKGAMSVYGPSNRSRRLRLCRRTPLLGKYISVYCPAVI